ncbi:ligase-associated DNA damage response endonuclease PdeM [Roseivirga sp. BDSF3-8]|uniref:ligase-associated DNA damage response endonuclease PdeM n=1 Tax=Roseivirga sp. BDSF3-8 TaxID=3241598 RepID=UPI003531DFA0
MIEAISQHTLSCTIELKGQRLSLLPQKCLFWHEEKTLILSDLHLGKAGHFRKAGIPIPGNIHFDDLQLLDELIKTWKPVNIIFIGDLFHSDVNSEWLVFEKWLESHHSLSFILVKGNHDILPPALYKNSRMAIFEDCLEALPFLFCHIPPGSHNRNEESYTLSGHLHPGVKLQGFGRQSETLPCFHFGNDGAVLPAFGRFTGLSRIKPAPGDKIFAIAGTRVISF